MKLRKNMKLGNKIYLLILFFFSISSIYAQESIITSPLINVDEIKPSFEELNEENDVIPSTQTLKQKKKSLKFKIFSSNFNRS